MTGQILLFFSAGIASFLITYPLVWLLSFFRMTQSVRKEGPKTHKIKAGTPTMGGVGFVLTIILLSLVFINFDFDFKYLALISLTGGFGLIGLADDWTKIIKKRNLGLTFWQKMILQIVLASGFALFLINLGHQESSGPILKFLGFTHPILYFLFSVFIVVGTANAANLTDGLNGLLAGTGGIAFLAFTLLCSRLNYPDAATFSAVAAGAILVFLVFNFPRAMVFMGDVGSLAIGTALAGVAIIIHRELSLILIGGIFVAEALSVIIQVSSYKLRKKRVFKMTPLHHHFELLGHKETKVVLGFWLAAGILGAVGAIF